MLKRYGRLMIATSLVSLLPTIAGLILWNRLPEQVPIHFDFEGNPDNYGSRAFAVFFIPLFYLLPLFFGTDGVWYTVPVSELAAFLCTGTALAVTITRMKRREAAQTAED